MITDRDPGDESDVPEYHFVSGDDPFEVSATDDFAIACCADRGEWHTVRAEIDRTTGRTFIEHFYGRIEELPPRG